MTRETDSGQLQGTGPLYSGRQFQKPTAAQAGQVCGREGPLVGTERPGEWDFWVTL